MLKSAVILSVAVLSALAAIRTVSALHLLPHPAVAPAAMVAIASAPSLSRHAGAAEVAKARDGHFWAEAQVNGRHVRFLVDTGATVVALTLQDARRLSIDTAALKFDRDVITAAGRSRAAGIDLAYVAVAGARVEHVPALVLENGLESSLLGMSYLGRLSRFEATPTALILRP